MILAVTLIAGALATYWATVSARALSGGPRSSFADVAAAMRASVTLSVGVFAIGAVWTVLADYATASPVNVRYDVLHAWLILVGPIVSLVIIPAAYGATNVFQQGRFGLGDCWRTYGFPSLVAAVYIALNVISFATDEIGGWSQVSLWKYALIPLHCLAVFASWIFYVRGMDRFVARRDHGRLSAC